MKANGHANRHSPPTVLGAAAESPKQDHSNRLFRRVGEPTGLTGRARLFISFLVIDERFHR